MAKFRARARTVDLLGRQQIAGIPTAVHELFKNAHDAYADNVAVDVFDQDKLFVLRDDGVGMSRQDFETRWLTVGTESKVRNSRLASPPVDTDKAPRPVLGEKGIGRLAIGSIGNALLVLSRARRGDESHPLMAAFVHWEVFSLPGIDLDQIEVPIEEVADGDRVDRALVRRLVGQFEACIRELLTGDEDEDRPIRAIVDELDRFDFDPWEQERFLPGNALKLSEGGRGTQFWVQPFDSVLLDDLHASDSVASPIQRQLLGFANTMTPEAPAPAVNITFRRHRGPTTVDEVLSPELFFRPGQMLNADHFISGRVDEFGVFRGQVAVFGEETTHLFDAGLVPGRQTRCGAFEVHLAVVQGVRRESTLPDEDWTDFLSRADRFGGVYVYLDGIRVLPYGNPDFDWLKIEERRSRGAGYYFFSHRRMCGAVTLTRTANAELQEKAGREGFVKNVAYRDLRAVVTNLLVGFAADFFRKEPRVSDRYNLEKDRLKRASKAAEARGKKSSAVTKEFADKIKDRLAWFEADGPRREAGAIREKHALRAEEILLQEGELQRASTLKLMSKASDDVQTLRKRLVIARPRVGLSESLERQWTEYARSREQVEHLVLGPLERDLEELIGDVVAAAEVDLDARTRLHKAVTPVVSAARADLTRMRKDLKAAQAAFEERFSRWSSAAFQDAEVSLRELKTSLNEGDVDAETLPTLRADLTARVHTLTAELLDNAGGFVDLLKGLQPKKESNPLEQLAALEQREIALRARLDEELEAAQIGMAVAVVSHEFGNLVGSIRESLRALKPWGKANPDLRRLIRTLTASFQHLDGYLNLFTPLQRRLYRSKQPITGAQLTSYVERLFGPKLEDTSIRLRVTDAFRESEIEGFPSTYYPVFVNLIDNAIFWLSEQTDAAIILDATDDQFIVQDNGPGIPADDVEWIFEASRSTKPGGRGLGLTISRDLLRREKGDLTADVRQPGEGAIFRLHIPPDDRIHEGEDE